MDLQEYLLNTVGKRKALLKLAETVYSQTQTAEISRKLSADPNDLYNGPTPQRLQQFEKQVNHNLQLIFNPNIPGSSKEQVKYLPTATVGENIKKIYSTNNEVLKRKQLVLIPKDYYFQPVKVPTRLMHRKYPSASPKIDIHVKKDKEIALKRTAKDDLFLPVLTTAGTHEARAKIYKYK
jgi:hypothetical protein